jgi:hypothetical protein
MGNNCGCYKTNKQICKLCGHKYCGKCGFYKHYKNIHQEHPQKDIIKCQAVGCNKTGLIHKKHLCICDKCKCGVYSKFGMHGDWCNMCAERYDDDRKYQEFREKNCNHGCTGYCEQCKETYDTRESDQPKSIYDNPYF